MAGPRQPLQLIMAKGAKHLTKQEIKERMSTEVQPCTDGIAAPSYLTAKQKKQFNTIAEQLQRLGIMGETDCDTLARYITAQSLYEQAVKDLRQIQTQKPNAKEAEPREIIGWADALNVMDKRVDRYYKQATSAASKLGLTISDRCKLVLPKAADAPKENKFARFGGKKAAGNE